MINFSENSSNFLDDFILSDTDEEVESRGKEEEIHVVSEPVTSSVEQKKETSQESSSDITPVKYVVIGEDNGLERCSHDVCVERNTMDSTGLKQVSSGAAGSFTFKKTEDGSKGDDVCGSSTEQLQEEIDASKVKEIDSTSEELSIPRLINEIGSLSKELKLAPLDEVGDNTLGSKSDSFNSINDAEKEKSTGRGLGGIVLLKDVVPSTAEGTTSEPVESALSLTGSKNVDTQASECSSAIATDSSLKAGKDFKVCLLLIPVAQNYFDTYSFIAFVITTLIF